MPVHIKPIVSIDSMPLVWGLRKQGPPDNISRAQWLFGQFTKRNTQVILSTVVLAEYLTAIDPAKHPDVIAELKKRYLIMPFDEKCASTAAVLFNAGKAMRTSGVAGGRAILRADTMIIATAKDYGAAVIYSDDADFRKLAKTVMDAEPMPTPDVDMFGDYIE